MKKFLPWIILAVVIIGMYSYVKGINNTAVTLDEDSQEAWGNVQTSYQRRNDLIGNLVKTVKGAADFEKSTLEAVTNAREEAEETIKAVNEFIQVDYLLFQETINGLRVKIFKEMQPVKIE